MNDFEAIRVERIDNINEKKLSIYNPTSYKLIGHGIRGAVFQLDDTRCIKISANPKDTIREAHALEIAKNLPFFPKVFEVGPNFIIMEYIKGIRLKDYIRSRKTLPEKYSKQILECIQGMKAIGFTKIHLKLNQILVTDEDELKFVDHSGAFTSLEPYPLRLLNELKKADLLHVFLEHMQNLDPEMYSNWAEKLDFSRNPMAMMNSQEAKTEDFEQISVTRIVEPDGSRKLIIDNPTNYRLIGKGIQGAVFQLDHERCVKFYVKPSFVHKEMMAIHAAKGLSFMPAIFQHGTNYIVMEYIEGPTLSQYLRKSKELKKTISQQILQIQRELKNAGFTRIESKLTHFIVTQGEVLKIIDHSDAFSYIQQYPNELFEDLKKIGLLKLFLEHARELDPEQYREWEKMINLDELIMNEVRKLEEKESLHAFPKVTVIIPTYNRAGIIHTAITSLKEQSLMDWKAIIIDDGSTDHTHEVIAEAIKEDARFSYFRMQQNMGICHVLNQALQLTDTEYMTQLDSDDWLEKTALERLLATMENEPKTTALIYGNYKIWKSKDIGKLVRVRGFRSSDKYDLISYVQMVYPRFYRTACLRDVGGWNVNDKYNGRYMEDRRIMFKLIEKYDFCWVDEHLYNLSRFNSKRLTAQENIHKYVELKTELVCRTLKQWGEEYTPVFISEDQYNQGAGWIQIKLIKRKTVGHILTEYLPLTETFIYQQIVRNSYFRNVVFTPKVNNREVFPLDHVLQVENVLLANELSQYRVDMLHAHFGPSALFALPAKEALGIPMLTFFHGYDARKYPYLNNKMAEYQRLFSIGELFLAPSNAIKQQLLSLGCPEHKVRVSRLGVDIDQFSFQPRALKGKEATIQLVSVGRLIEKKGHHILIEALSIVKEKIDHFHLTIIGEGENHQALAEQVDRLGLSDHVDLAGSLRHAEVKEALNKADIFCLASMTGKDGNMEGLPVSILEAQAVGLPIVSTRHSGIPEGVIEGKSALLAEENNPVDLANKLLEMMSQPEKWTAIGSAGRELIVQQFNADKQAEELRDIYLELLGDDRR